MSISIDINVHSEIGTLQTVLLHTPRKKELERMTPSNHDALLFDDILCWTLAVEEHYQFRRLFEDLGVKVLDVAALPKEEWETLPARARSLFPRGLWSEEKSNLLLAALEGTKKRRKLIYKVADAEEKAFKDIFKESQYGEDRAKKYSEELTRRLEKLCSNRLTSVLLEGIVDNSFARATEQGSPFLLRPIPNLMFARDPAAAIGNQVLPSLMARPARQREGILFKYIFDHFHCDLIDLEEIEHFKVEGGDVLVLHDRILAIGCSERTTKDALEQLATRLFERVGGGSSKQGVEIIYAVLMPQQRRTMHLDTIFTMLSENEFLVYPPLMLPSGIEQAKVIKIQKDNTAGPRLQEVGDLIGDLRGELKQFHLIKNRKSYRYCNKDLDLERGIFRCGGSDPIVQDREQWCDGTNMLALAPGIVVGYERNEGTFRELVRHNYEIVVAGFDDNDNFALRSTNGEDLTVAIRKQMDDLAKVEGPPIVSERRKKYAIKIQGSELSRARGGPRCMTMPLKRAPVPWERLGWSCQRVKVS